MAIAEQQELVAAIAAHLEKGEEGNWSAVREQFPAVSDASFWRYVRKVRTGDVGMPLKKARQRLEAHIISTAASANAIEKRQTPGGPWRNLDVLAHVARGFDDVELLRRYATTANGEIKNPVIFSQCIGLRDRLVATAVKCGEAVIAMDRLAETMDLLVDEVAAEAPDCARRIMTRLAVLRSTEVL